MHTTPDEVKLTFSTDRDIRTYDIVIGCDGPQSTVRAFMYGQEGSAKPLDGTSGMRWRSLVCYHDAKKAKHVRSAHPVVAISIHPDLLFFLGPQDAHDSANPAEWTFIVDLHWVSGSESAGDGVEALEMAKKKADKLCEPFRSAIRWIPDDTVMQASGLNVWIPRPLERRLLSPRVLLAGDAAHAMPPFRGQGLNHAIQDSYNLVQTIKRLTEERATGAAVDEALDAYAEEVIVRGAAETKASILNGKMMADYYDFKSSPYAKKGFSKG